MFIITKLGNRRHRLRVFKERIAELVDSGATIYAGESTPYMSSGGSFVLDDHYRHGRGKIVRFQRSLNGYTVQLSDGQWFDFADCEVPNRERDWKFNENGYGNGVSRMGIRQLSSPYRLRQTKALAKAQAEFEQLSGTEDPHAISEAAQRVIDITESLTQLDRLIDDVKRLAGVIREAFGYDQTQRYYSVNPTIIYQAMGYGQELLDPDELRALDVLKARADWSESDRHRGLLRTKFRAVNLASYKYVQPQHQAEYQLDKIKEAQTELEALQVTSSS